MKDNEIIFEGNVMEIISDSSLQTLDLKIMYRIKNIDNRYFFAEEISTGAIFPTYCFEDYSKNKYHFRTLSYLRKGKYFIFAAIDSEKDVFDNYSLFEKEQKDIQRVPSIEEINEYLNSSSPKFKNVIRDYELSNEFMCYRDIIKNLINVNKVSDGFDYSAQYKTKIDLKDISDYGYDLSLSERLCDVVGRDREIKEIIKKTAIKNSSVMLIGEAGCGKTAIVETLALHIKRSNNKWLNDKTIISINANSLVSNTKFRGEFETKLKKLVEFSIKNKGHVILFIDEIHMLKGLGTSDEQRNLDATNILKPFLSNRDVVIIGATTKEEYEILTDDEAFCGRFDNIEVGLLSKKMNCQILRNYIEELSNCYNIEFPFNEQDISLIIENLLSVTDIKNQRIIGHPKVTNPRLSKNILEDAFVEAVYNERKEVLVCDIIKALDCDKISPTIRKEIAISLEKGLKYHTSLNELESNNLVLKIF